MRKIKFIRKLVASVLIITMTFSLTGCGMFTIAKKSLKSLESIRNVFRDNKEDIEKRIEDEINDKLGDLEETFEGLDEELSNLVDSVDDVNSQRDYSTIYVPYTWSLGYACNYGDGNYILNELSYQKLSVDSSYPELSKAIDAYTKDLEERITQDYDLSVSEVNEYDDLRERLEEYGGSCTYEHELGVVRHDEEFFTFISRYYSYAGGVHPYTGYGGYNYETDSGKLISSDELFTDGKLAAEVIAKKILDEYDTEMFWVIDESLDTPVEKQLYNAIYGDYISEDKEYDLQFVLGYEGIKVFFNAYDLTAYAAGAIDVFIPYEEAKDFVNNKYIKPSKEYISFASINPTESFKTILPNGKIANVMVSGCYEYGECDETEDSDCGDGEGFVLNIDVDGNTLLSQDVCGEDYDVLVLSKNNKKYLYIVGDSGSGYTSIFDISEGKPEFIIMEKGYVDDMFFPEYIYLNYRVDFLSTYFATSKCTVEPNGKLNSVDGGMLVIDDDFQFSLTSKVDLKVKSVNKDTLADGVDKTIPKNSEFKFKYTDGISYVIFELSDGSLVKLLVDKLPRGLSIDGMDESECFESLWYASY